jgi:hypothetical protein
MSERPETGQPSAPNIGAGASKVATVTASEDSPSPGGHPKKRRSLGLQVGGALVILLIGLLIGFFVVRGQTSGDEALLAETRDQLGQLQRALEQSEDRNWTYYRANQALRAELEEANGTGQPDATNGSGSGQPSGVFGDGVYVVGEDIAPGTYEGVVANGTGYWARLRATDGSTGAIIANAIVQGPFELTIYVGDRAVELRGVTITAR